MALSEKCIAWLEKEHAEVTARRGDEWDRWYGLLTADLEWLEYHMRNPYDYDDDDIYDLDYGVEAATQAEDWLEDFYWQVLDEVYECDTEKKFIAKFHPNCSLAWLYFFGVLHWDEYAAPMIHLKKLNEERESYDDWDYKPLPQWILDEVKEYEEE